MRGLEDGNGVPENDGLTSDTSKEMVFDSSSIKRRDSADLFTNVEGQAERDKENAKIEAAHLRDVEKRRQEFQQRMHAKSVAEAQQRKREFEAQQRAEEKARHDAYLLEKKRERADKKAARREKFHQSAFYRIFFKGWHKFVTIFAILAILIGSPFLYIYVIQPAISEKEFNEQSAVEDKGREYANTIREKADSFYDGTNDNAYEDAIALFEEEFAKNIGVSKFYIGLYYAEFTYVKAGDYNRALDILDSLDSLRGDDVSMTVEYYAHYKTIYILLDNADKVAEYEQLMYEVDPSLQNGPIEGVQGDE